MRNGISSPRRPTDPIGSVDNALRLLLLLRDRRSITVSQASVELGIGRSTAHRLLAMLRAYDLVGQDPVSRVYRPGPMLLELALAVTGHDDVVAALRPILEGLVDALGETAHVIVLDGSNCRFVDSIESTHALRSTARVGVVYPAHATAGGKALLATLSEPELFDVYPDEHIAQLNELSLTSRAELISELEQIRVRGYAVNFGQSEMGIHAVAMVQRSRSGATPAALAVSAPEQRLSEADIPPIVAALQRATDEAARRLP
jgi:IclR family acetate operon transcriptional repressor